MITTINIRQAGSKDLAALHALATAALPFDVFSANHLGEKLFFNPHPDLDEYHTLVAERDGRVIGMLQHVVRSSERKSWLGIFAVEANIRRGGIGRQLYDTALTFWRACGIRTVDTLTIPTNYLVPGIDPRYTPACCFVESVGFVQRAAKANMRAYLDSDFDTHEREAAFEAQGITIRRAAQADTAVIEQFFGRYFGEGWLAEVRQAMLQTPPSVHLAIRNGEIIAFSAHSTMNREWGNFGPMGTADEARGLGLGRVLLYRCMADLKAAGHRTAVIPWIGPYPFYCRLLDCHIDRVFWQYRLELPG